MDTEDIAALYTLARQAMIPAGQAMQVASLFLKVERVIAQGQADPFVSEALAKKAKANGSDKSKTAQSPKE